MRLVFAGTPEPAAVALSTLIASEHEVVAVITRPDARKGRGRSLHPSPVKELAHSYGIEVLTPQTLKDNGEIRQVLREAAFTDDFVLTTDEGTTVRMTADGNTTVERSRGDAAKGLTAQDLQVSRQVSQSCTSATASVRRAASGSVSRSQRSFVTVNEATGTEPTASAHRETWLPALPPSGPPPDLDALPWKRLALLWLNFPGNPTAATARS